MSANPIPSMNNAAQPAECAVDSRRRDIRQAGLNGLDYLEVGADGRTLVLYLLSKAPKGLKPANFTISGGRRVRNIQVTQVETCKNADPERDDCVVLHVDRTGDFSTYRICIVEVDASGKPTGSPYPGFDRRYACLDFTFAVNCPSPLDCKDGETCPPEAFDEPAINYLARDYASLRQLIFDRLSTQMPDWKERHVPDLGVTLVELMAYVGDYLSYYQDAVATEAYLNTARRRISVRRHARLVDYDMHEGCNARAWLHLRVDGGRVSLPANTFYFITSPDSATNNGRPINSEALDEGRAGTDYEVFEPLPLDLSNERPEFEARDLKDARCLARRLLQPDPLARYALEHMGDGVEALLQGLSDERLPLESASPQLAERMNRLLREERLWDGQRFNNMDASPETRLMLQYRDLGLLQGRELSQPPSQNLGPSQSLAPGIITRYQQMSLAWLNRALLEDAFPQEIARKPKPLPDGTLYRFYEEHNEMHFYTWGERECCLPQGATSATLIDAWGPRESIPMLPPPKDEAEKDETPAGKPPGKGSRAADRSRAAKRSPLPEKQSYAVSQPPQEDQVPLGDCERARRLANLQPGDLLLIEETIGPGTGAPADADPRRRHIVRLTTVRFEVDTLYDQPVVEVEWSQEDALPFQACISTVVPEYEDCPCVLVENITVARGNILLVDHGRRVERPLGTVPERTGEACCEAEGERSDVLVEAGPFAPVLPDVPLTFWQPLSPDGPAARMLAQDPRQALPAVQLAADPPTPGGPTWTPRRDLLDSRADDQDFMVEVDDNGYAHLRFGDGELGERPAAGTRFAARYRVGSGAAGNVGAEMINRIVLRKMSLSGVRLYPRNPLPASGGTAPETVADVKRLAPHAYRRELQRAVIAEDYAALAQRSPAVQRAAAQINWTGSWYEARVALDALGGEAGASLLEAIEAALYPYRRIGHDLALRPAATVPLDIRLKVCVRSDFIKGHVQAALLDAFSTRRLLDGRLGFFHPDALTFGQGIYLSHLVAAALSVPGVESVVVERLERFGRPDDEAVKSGALILGPFEIARLDNDPSFPENGRLELDMIGGR